MKRFIALLKAVADVFGYWHACLKYDWWMLVAKVCLVIGGKAMAKADNAKLTLDEIKEVCK